MANVTLNLVAINGQGQLHTYPNKEYEEKNPVDHWANLVFDEITTISNGHHVRLGAGYDTFNFTNIDNVNNVIVGRIEDFDASRDEIRIEGELLDFNNLPSYVRIVEYNGDHNDPGADPQQWILIDTGDGKIFYSLEGARVDMNGDGASQEGDQEAHFIHEGNIPNFSTLKDVKYTDPINFVPDGYTPDGGIVYNDEYNFDLITHDAKAADVLEVIAGSTSGDLIAAGLNDDTVEAKGGHDHVWGGSGHDTVFGQGGADTLEGNLGDDRLVGNVGNDLLLGGNGHDTLIGGDGNDVLVAGNGHDIIEGSAGNDKLYFGNRSHDAGGWGENIARGGTGADQFIFEGVSGWTRVEDFENGIDKFRFTDPNIDSMSDLTITRYADENKVIINFNDGVIRVDIENVNAIDASDFLFN
ncbi:calcium-binding protein [Paracoccus alkanivorans]|uniref:Calcium-binding protein n=1 Tax=Paracoccus alkanivorans TaxID=2116655 RepID=A0A3M0M8C7_9RHOB|nr:calcium-binding protein [Paracoccus alkanivorans]RMC33761.1 calcium-binding protein [Paracoccus alkanivorans]